MYHKILFRRDCEVECLPPKPRSRMEKMKIKSGDIVDAQVRPHLEPGRPPDDLADLMMGDGYELIGVPYDYFRFE